MSRTDVDRESNPPSELRSRLILAIMIAVGVALAALLVWSVMRLWEAESTTATSPPQTTPFSRCVQRCEAQRPLTEPRRCTPVPERVAGSGQLTGRTLRNRCAMTSERFQEMRRRRNACEHSCGQLLDGLTIRERALERAAIILKEETTFGRPIDSAMRPRANEQ